MGVLVGYCAGEAWLGKMRRYGTALWFRVRGYYAALIVQCPKAYAYERTLRAHRPFPHSACIRKTGPQCIAQAPSTHAPRAHTRPHTSLRGPALDFCIDTSVLFVVVAETLWAIRAGYDDRSRSSKGHKTYER